MLITSKKSLERFWNKISRWKSWIANSKPHGIIFKYIEKVLLADVFESFRNKCIEIYELDLAWQDCFKKTEKELELLTDIDMLLMICNIDMQQQIINIWKIMTKTENRYILSI